MVAILYSPSYIKNDRLRFSCCVWEEIQRISLEVTRRKVRTSITIIMYLRLIINILWLPYFIRRVTSKMTVSDSVVVCGRRYNGSAWKLPAERLEQALLLLCIYDLLLIFYGCHTLFAELHQK